MMDPKPDLPDFGEPDEVLAGLDRIIEHNRQVARTEPRNSKPDPLREMHKRVCKSMENLVLRGGDALQAQEIYWLNMDQEFRAYLAAHDAQLKLDEAVIRKELYDSLAQAHAIINERDQMVAQARIEEAEWWLQNGRVTFLTGQRMAVLRAALASQEKP